MRSYILRFTLFAVPILGMTMLFAFSHRPVAHAAAATGSVRCIVKGAPVGDYHAWLFQTGAAQPSNSIAVHVGAYQAPTVTFSNIPTGHRYFVRVVDTTCAVGGQSSDGQLNSGTLNLPPCNVTINWTSGCPN